MPYNDNRKKLGALWKRMSKNNNEYVSGFIEVDGKKVDFYGTFNSNPKDPDRSPHFFLYESEPREQKASAPAASAASAAAKPAAKPAAAKRPAPAPVAAAPTQEEPPI